MAKRRNAPDADAVQPDAEVVQEPTSDLDRSGTDAGEQAAQDAVLEVLGHGAGSDAAGDQQTPPEGGQETPATEATETPPSAEEPAPGAVLDAEGESGPESAAPGDSEAGGEEEVDEEGIPVGIGERAQARFRDLTSQLGQARQLVEQYEPVIEAIQATGAPAPRVQQMLGYLTLANKPNPSLDELGMAKTALESELSAVNARLGIVPDDTQRTSLIAQYPDLVAAVENMEITSDLAAQMAAMRTQQANNDAYQQQVQQETVLEQQYRQRVAAGSRAISAMEQEFMRLDPHAPAILEHLKSAVPDIVRSAQPEQWAERVKERYMQLKTLLTNSAPGNAGAAPARPKGDPLTQNAAGTGKLPPPETAQDAIMDMLGHPRD